MKKAYLVDLLEGEQTELLEFVGIGELRARKLSRVHILLLASERRTNKNIADDLHTSPSTLEGREGAL